MARLGQEVRYSKRYRVTTDSDHNKAISPNTLDRQFAVAAPNQIWTTDVTSVWTLEGWLYVAYASQEYRGHLTIMKMEQSMSRKGNCWDNAPKERFFGSLRQEQLNYEKLKTHEAAKLQSLLREQLALKKYCK